VLIADLYDPSTGKFTPTGDMVAPMPFAMSTLLDSGMALMVDAVSDFRRSGPELYDPVAGTFRAAAGNADGRLRFNACGTPIVLASGTVLIAPGCGPAHELYDAMTDTLSFTGTRLTIGYYDTTSTLLTNGNVLIAGGDGDFGVAANAELYNPSIAMSMIAGDMVHARAGHTATLLRDGTVLVAGGDTSSGALPNLTAELYNPSTGTFEATADMTSPRSWHTATWLMDGRLLIAGGYDSSSSFPRSSTSSAELYVQSMLSPAQIVTKLRFDRTSVVAGSSYSVDVSGSNIGSRTFFDVRFTRPGSVSSEVALNWQTGVVSSHDVPSAIALGNWTINGVRAHEIETDHTGIFFPVSATIAVLESQVTDLRFDRTSVVAGSSFVANISGSNLTPQTFFDVRFTAPGSTASDVALNWQTGTQSTHNVPSAITLGDWTINGVRPHQIETDHSGDFFPVLATITVLR
jgi:hypothetical protein